MLPYHQENENVSKLKCTPKVRYKLWGCTSY